jgi:Na+-transporting NADH:ubiquinone oxidoreductase subunit F
MAQDGIQRKATFFYGANEMRDLYLIEEMRGFEQTVKNFTHVPVLARPRPEDGWEGETGLVTEALDRAIEDASTQGFYLCGSPAMIDACIELLKSKGAAEDAIYYDKFA